MPADKRVCLVLDGHSSRKGWHWLQKCVNHDIEVVQSHTNNSHFLQPCDADMNKTFHKSVRKTIAFLSETAVMDFSGISMKLRLGVIGYKSISREVLTSSFEKCGLGPIEYHFVNKEGGFYSVQVKSNLITDMIPTCAKSNNVPNVSGNTRGNTAESRQGEVDEVMFQVESIYKTEQAPEKRSQKLRLALDDYHRIQNVLKSHF